MPWNGEAYEAPQMQLFDDTAPGGGVRRVSVRNSETRNFAPSRLGKARVGRNGVSDTFWAYTARATRSNGRTYGLDAYSPLNPNDVNSETQRTEFSKATSRNLKVERVLA